MKEYIKSNKFKLVTALLAVLACAFGVIDPAVAGMLFFIGDVEPGSVKELHTAMQKAFETMTDKVKAGQDLAQSAIDQIKRGDEVHAKTADQLKTVGEASTKAQNEFKEAMNGYAARLQAIEQKLDKKTSDLDARAAETETAGEIFAKSDAYKQMISSRGFNSLPVVVNRKAAILNVNPIAASQPLVDRIRLPGIIMPGLRRFTIRDLLPQIPTASNLIEFAQELLFTNNTAPQGSGASPDGQSPEGQVFNESSLTFQLSNAAVITIGHYIPASRQILSDAQQLQGYINSRLTYGLKLDEEDELLNQTGAAGKLNGLRNQATAFNGGATNQTIIDTLLKAFTQVSLAYFDATAAVLHPTDWQTVLLQKDTLGRYLFSDPHSAATPSIWGKTVVPTQAMTQGQFITGAFDLAAAIYDREDVTIRVAEQHSDWFTRNLVAIACEERLALAIYRPASIVAGGLNYAG